MSHRSRAASQSSRQRPRADWGPGADCPTPARRAPLRIFGTGLDVLKVRGGQLAALAHNVVAELLPFIEVAHSGAFDCGNMDEHVLSTVGRLNEAKTPL